MKHLFVQIFLVVLLLNFVSCSTCDEISFAEQKTEVNIVEEIQQLNFEIIKKSPQRTERREGKGWRSWTTKQKAAVITADFGGCYSGGKVGAGLGAKIGLGLGSPLAGGVTGAFLGGVIGGAYASWLASPDYVLKSENEEDDYKKLVATCEALVTDENFSIANIDEILIKNDSVKMTIDNSTLKISRLDNTSLCVGQMHNVLLASMNGKIATKQLEPTKSGALRSQIINKNSQIEDQKLILNSTSFTDSCFIVAKKASQGVISEEDPVVNKILKLFENVLKEYSTEIDDVAFIIGKYNEIIDHTSELTEEQKSEIKATLSTALYSAAYWSNNNPN